MPSNGSGWVSFEVIHASVLSQFERYCRINPRNALTRYDDRRAIWRREPNEHGCGVADGNEERDFLRALANAVTRIACSTVNAQRPKDWPSWNYRECVASIVKIHDSGWNVTARETTSELERLTIDLTVNTDGDVVTGTVRRQ